MEKEEKITGIKAVMLMWKNTFKYDGEASLTEYWTPIVFHGIFCAVSLLISFFNGPAIIAKVIAVYLILSIVPWISLTVRRLHDTGKSGWWAFLTLIIGIGLIILVALCSFKSESQMNVEESYDPSQNIESEVYGPPSTEEDDYEPSFNEEPMVYGPPSDFG